MPQVARTDEDIARCFDVMSELRPHVQREEFVPLVRQMEPEGYRMAFVEQAGEVVAVAGYRIATSLHLGRHMYLNDLVTAARARSQGHGDTLLRWLRSQAVEAGCRYLDLDSGVQRSRAHKFYFEQGFVITGYHFSRRLDGA